MTHDANIASADFWRALEPARKKEYLHVDTLYNRRFLEQARALAFGAITGLGAGLLLLRVKNRLLVASLASGVSCAAFCQLRSGPVHSQYFKVWEAVRNDEKAVEAIRSGSEQLSAEDFAYFYHRYLRLMYPELAEGKGASKINGPFGGSN